MFKPRYSPKQLHYFRKMMLGICILVVLISLLSCGARLHWTLDLFSHFRVQYVQLSLLMAGICLWVRFNKTAAALILAGLFNYAFVYPLYTGKPAPPDRKPVRIMLLNLNADNGQTEQVLAAIREARPDLLLLEEVTPRWVEELAVLAPEYAYMIDRPREDRFGIMLLGKYPLEHGKVVQTGAAGTPSIIAEAHLPDGVVSIIGTHLLPPLGAEYSRLRNDQLAELPRYVKEQKYPVLLLGDLNTTPWSPHFQSLEKDSGLQDSTKGFGFQPTWRINAFLKIPIDHVLHAEEIVIHNRMIGPDVGSDHRPVIVDFSL